MSSTSVSAVSASLRMANAGMEGKASHVVQRSNASSRQRFQPARRTVKITAPVPAQSEPASTGASVLLTWPLTTGCRLTPPSLATLRLPTAEASHIGPASELAALRCSFARSLAAESDLKAASSDAGPVRNTVSLASFARALLAAGPRGVRGWVLCDESDGRRLAAPAWPTALAQPAAAGSRPLPRRRSSLHHGMHRRRWRR